MNKYTPCPFCGAQPVIKKDWCDHDILVCPNGHRRSAPYNWNETNATLLKQFNRVLENATCLKVVDNVKS